MLQNVGSRLVEALVATREPHYGEKKVVDPRHCNWASVSESPQEEVGYGLLVHENAGGVLCIMVIVTHNRREFP